MFAARLRHCAERARSPFALFVPSAYIAFRLFGAFARFAFDLNAFDGMPKLHHTAAKCTKVHLRLALRRSSRDDFGTPIEMRTKGKTSAHGENGQLIAAVLKMNTAHHFHCDISESTLDLRIEIIVELWRQFRHFRIAYA